MKGCSPYLYLYISPLRKKGISFPFAILSLLLSFAFVTSPSPFRFYFFPYLFTSTPSKLFAVLLKNKIIITQNKMTSDPRLSYSSLLHFFTLPNSNSSSDWGTEFLVSLQGRARRVAPCAQGQLHQGPQVRQRCAAGSASRWAKGVSEGAMVRAARA